MIRASQCSKTATSRDGGLTAAQAYPPSGGYSRILSRFAKSPSGSPEGASHAAWLYAATLLLGVLVAAIALARTGSSLEAPAWVLAALCFVGLLAERQSIRITSYLQVSVSALPILFAAVVYGPFAAMLVGGCAMLGDFGRPYIRWVVWTSSRSLAGGAAGVVAILLIPDAPSFTSLLLGVAGAALAEAVLDIAFASLTAVVRRRSWLETIQAMGWLTIAALPLYTPVIGVLTYAYVELSPWTILLFFVPAVAAQRLFVLYQEQRRLAGDLVVANDRLEAASVSFASALVAALDARDRYTAGHSAAVAVYARDIAAELGLSEERQQLAHRCGLLHDIGKVGLPAAILEKTGVLTRDERSLMEEHAVIGQRILANIENYAEIAMIVRHHHERVDGNGYPDGLEESAIPLISRIIAVADAYNAMTSGRPYRGAMPSHIARMRLAHAAGSQFDSAVVAAFEAILRDASETYRSGARADFALEAQRQSEPVVALASNAA